MLNPDETHFCVNLDDGRTLAVKGETGVKYSDVMSGAIGMTLMIMLGGGMKPCFEIPMVTLQHDRCSHPI